MMTASCYYYLSKYSTDLYQQESTYLGTAGTTAENIGEINDQVNKYADIILSNDEQAIENSKGDDLTKAQSQLSVDSQEISTTQQRWKGMFDDAQTAMTNVNNALQQLIQLASISGDAGSYQAQLFSSPL